jgi:hypothetical protein
MHQCRFGHIGFWVAMPTKRKFAEGTIRCLVFPPQTIRLDHSEAVVSLRPPILGVCKGEPSLRQGEQHGLLGSRGRVLTASIA